MEVEIEYCVPCGHLGRAIDVQRGLLQRFGQRLEAVRLKTGHGGVFTIRADGDQILDARTDGFDPAEIHRHVEQRLSTRTDPAGP